MDNDIRNEYLSAMGIDVWLARDTVDNIVDLDIQSEIKSEKNIDNTSNDVVINNLDWSQLLTQVAQCQNCELHLNKTNNVFGSGNQQADLFVIGAIPNDAEDNAAKEFVGLEGKLLDNMLSVLDLSRNDIFSANLLKCKSQTHRHFSNSELSACVAYLERQIDLVKPKAVIIFGEQIAQFILKTDKSMTVLTTQMHDYSEKDILVVVMDHPEQLLLSPKNKRQAWLSLLQVKTVLS